MTLSQPEGIAVTMPQLGETVAEGTVTRWLKGVGDEVADQEPLLEISTDKVDTEVPSPGAGTLLEIIVDVESTVAVGTTLAVIGPAGVGRRTPAPPAVPRGPRHRHSPRVRRLAREAGLDLDALSGSGPRGRTTPADIAAATQVPAAPQLSPQGPRESAVSSERSPAMVLSIPQATTVVEIDVTAAVQAQRRHAPRISSLDRSQLTLTAIFARAAIDSLRAAPPLNSSVGSDGPSLVHHATVNLGIAVDTERGVVVPVIKDAGSLNVSGLARAIEDVFVRARARDLHAEELIGATFTLSNPGDRGALFDTPILAPGQGGVLGAGAVIERPVVQRSPDGEPVIAIRSMAHFALTYDHRLVDGADAARFLTAVKDRLESNPVDAELA